MDKKLTTNTNINGEDIKESNNNINATGPEALIALGIFAVAFIVKGIIKMITIRKYDKEKEEETIETEEIKEEEPIIEEPIQEEEDNPNRIKLKGWNDVKESKEEE